MRHNILGRNYRYRWFYLSRNQSWRSEKASFSELVKEADLDWGAAWNEDSWKGVEKRIEEAHAFSIEKGFTLLIACLPVSFQVYADFLNDFPQRRLRGIAEKHNLPFVDCLPTLREHKDTPLFYDHCHLNEEGQNIVAKELSRYILNEGILR